MDEVAVDRDGRVRLHATCGGVRREWQSLPDLATDYVAFVKLSSEAMDSADWAAWDCVEDLTDRPAWAGVVDLIGALLAAAGDDAVGLIAPGPLWEIINDPAEAPRFIDEIEARARLDSLWASAVAGVWLNSEDIELTDVNRRLARFGARYADGTSPSQ
jgi:hypothetical protein